MMHVLLRPHSESLSPPPGPHMRLIRCSRRATTISSQRAPYSLQPPRHHHLEPTRTRCSCRAATISSKCACAPTCRSHRATTISSECACTPLVAAAAPPPSRVNALAPYSSQPPCHHHLEPTRMRPTRRSRSCLDSEPTRFRRSSSPPEHHHSTYLGLVRSSLHHHHCLDPDRRLGKIATVSIVLYILSEEAASPPPLGLTRPTRRSRRATTPPPSQANAHAPHSSQPQPPQLGANAIRRSRVPRRRPSSDLPLPPRPLHLI